MTQEELNTIKEEVEILNNKLAELTDEELAQVTGGATGGLKPFSREKGFGFISSEQVKVVCESKDLIHVGNTTLRVGTNYPLEGDDEEK